SFRRWRATRFIHTIIVTTKTEATSSISPSMPSSLMRQRSSPTATATLRAAAAATPYQTKRVRWVRPVRERKTRMMPTTRAAATPSPSATRNAESTDDPVCPSVSNLQLQIRVYLSRTFQVNRTNSVRFPPGRNRLFCFLHMATLRQASSLTLSSLVLFSQLSFAQSQPPAAQAPAERVRPDPKRARKAAEQGEKAEAAGHLEDALAAYEEAAHYAPKEIAFAE